MRWRDVVVALRAAAVADPTLSGLLGGPRVEWTGTLRDPQVPGVAWTRVASNDGEAMDSVLLQWDVFATDETMLAQIEAALRDVVVWRAARTVGGELILAEARGGRDHPAPESTTLHRSFDVRYEVAR